jgi:hypothetical protein
MERASIRSSGSKTERRSTLAADRPHRPDLAPRIRASQPEKKAFFGSFVIMKGGELFFTPSIPFLNALA